MTDQTTDHPVDNRQIVYITPYPGMSGGESDGINLLALWDIIWKKRFFIAVPALLLTLVAVYVTLFVLPETYRSEAALIQTGSGISESTTGGLASLASTLQLPIPLPGGSTGDKIMVFLQSQSMQRKLIEKYDLLPRLYKSKWDPEKKAWLVDNPSERPTAVFALQKEALKEVFVVTQDDQTKLITISWVDESPAFAAEMLKSVIGELDYYLTHEFVSEAKRQRQFVEKQLAGATLELEHWERQVPTDEVSRAKIQRETLAATAVYTELRKQVELARLIEAKEVVNFKVVDPPYVPEVRFKPKRTLICAATFVLAGALSLTLVLIWQMVAMARKRGSSSGNGE